VTRLLSLGSLACWALCGVIAGCAASAAPPAAQPDAQPAPAAQQSAPQTVFASTTESPQPVPSPSADPALRELGAACGESDQALLTVAAHFTAARGERATELDVDAIGYALRAAGAPYVWPRAWLFNGTEGEVSAAKSRMQRWLAGFGDGGVRRCGVVLQHDAGGRISVGALAVDVLADLEPLPTQVRVGQWLDVRATLRVPASAAKLVILGPHGAPHAVPTSFSDGHVRARFNADQPGAWLVQLLAAVDGGPRPLLEALVFAGVDPPSELEVPKAPGEEAAAVISEPLAALYAMVDAARQAEGLSALTRDPRLEALARAHAEAMRRARKTAHDAGDGDLNQRLEAKGLTLAAGENVAHAGNAVLAQRALWASPSHRENLLFPGFNLAGIGVALDPDGTLWVCQVFGTGRAQ
jgi:hypothetical protein